MSRTGEKGAGFRVNRKRRIHHFSKVVRSHGAIRIGWDTIATAIGLVHSLKGRKGGRHRHWGRVCLPDKIKNLLEGQRLPGMDWKNWVDNIGRSMHRHRNRQIAQVGRDSVVEGVTYYRRKVTGGLRRLARRGLGCGETDKCQEHADCTKDKSGTDPRIKHTRSGDGFFMHRILA